MKQRGSIKENSIVPKFRSLYLERFLRLIELIDTKDAVSQREEIRNELAWCNNLTHEGIDRLKYRATLMVLGDIMGQGWRTRYRHRSIFLVRPDYTHGKHRGIDHALIKQQIRSALQEQRLAHINTPSTVRFIDRMERPPKGKSSIFDLLTSGKDFARDLRCLPENPNEADLRKAIDPYLQLIRSDETDRISGLKLSDIWRYLRYLWAIPYQSTPGRNMFYLVRDASRPNHPIIGISALGNCVVKLSERDQTIGWSVGWGIRLDLYARPNTPSASICLILAGQLNSGAIPSWLERRSSGAERSWINVVMRQQQARSYRAPMSKQN